MNQFQWFSRHYRILSVPHYPSKPPFFCSCSQISHRKAIKNVLIMDEGIFRQQLMSRTFVCEIMYVSSCLAATSCSATTQFALSGINYSLAVFGASILGRQRIIISRLSPQARRYYKFKDIKYQALVIEPFVYFAAQCMGEYHDLAVIEERVLKVARTMKAKRYHRLIVIFDTRDRR